MSLDCVPVLPIKVLEPSEEDSGFAGYVCGPIDGELSLDVELEDLFDEETDEELERDPELDEVEPDPPPEGKEELPPGSLSEDEPNCGFDDTGSDILPGSSEPETTALPTSMILAFCSDLPEHPESTQIAAAIEIAPLNLFFIIHFPNFCFLYINVLYSYSNYNTFSAKSQAFWRILHKIALILKKRTKFGKIGE